MIRSHFRSAGARGAVAIPLALLVLGATAGQADSARHGQRPRYLAIDLPGSLGGSSSSGRSISPFGLVTGISNRPGNATRHATVWIGAHAVSLGTLGGPNSAILWQNRNARGLIVGVAERADMDPRGEAFSCSAFFPGGLANPTGHVCRGFVWQHGAMRELPTHGGTHSFATTANNLGQVVGWAETSFEDPSCMSPQVYQFKGAVWNARTRQIEETIEPMPLPGHTVSTANTINDRGQIAGISGECDQAVGRASAKRAFLWENGEHTDLGTLGAELWNTPTDINQRGDIVGFAGVPQSSGGVQVHAFAWTRAGGIQALPREPDDAQTEAWSVNERRQTVGLANGPNGLRAVLWQNGEMLDLNDIVQRGYRSHLFVARGINDLGVITGQSRGEDGVLRTFVAIPLP